MACGGIEVLLLVVPLTLNKANELVASWHRHHKPVVGHRFSVGVKGNDGCLHGAAIVGRPVSREVAQYDVAEITRLVTDGYANACSFLYGACARVAKEMGFTSIQTYILASESGVSLKAAGWNWKHRTNGGDWNTLKRKGRRTDQPQEPKDLWEKILRSKEGLMDGNTTVVAPALPAGPTIAQRIEQYIKIRDKVKEIKDKHVEELKPYAEVMLKLEGVIMNALNTAGVDSMKADAGTAYKSTETSVSVKDWPQTFEFIKSSELWDLLEARVSKTAALAVIEETGKPIPGVNVSQSESLRVRRS